MTDSEGSEELRWFRRVEEVFLELRGAPMLLSPKDWQTAERWRTRGVPIDVVEGALREVFERRAARGVRGRVSSLAYCAPAVEAAWEQIRDLSAVGDRRPVEAIDVSARLDLLAQALPERLPEREAWRDRIRGLSETLSSTEEVEEALRQLERDWLAQAARALSEQEQKALEAAVDRALDSLTQRLDARGLERVEERVRAQWLRRHFEKPVWSLFA